MGSDEDIEEQEGIYSAFSYDDEEEGVGEEIDTEEDNADTPSDSSEEGELQTKDTIEESHSSEPYVPPSPDTEQKSSAETILASGPHKLNKTLILSILFGTFTLFIILTLFIMPLFGKKSDVKTKKPGVLPVSTFDYSSLVPARQVEKPEEKTQENKKTEKDDEEILANLPPIDPQFQYKVLEEKPTPAATAAGKTAERPDTKGDGLQTKTIRGIKGISPSQNSYTDSPTTPILSGDNGTANPYARFGMPSKEEYTSQMLSQSSYGNSSSVNGPSFPPTSYTSQNDQTGKMGFYASGREGAGAGVWLGPATVWQGTIFEAILTSDINTDLPGEVSAMTSKNIYSSLDGRYLLIPQNSRLYGSYNSNISYSQRRVQVGWHTLIRPDGYMVNLGNMMAADSQGAAGLPGWINDHYFQYFKAIILMSIFNVISSEFNATANSSTNPYVQNLMADSQNVTATLGAKLIERAMDVQPTITIKAGIKINIVANTNLALPPLEPYSVTSPYHR